MLVMNAMIGGIDCVYRSNFTRIIDAENKKWVSTHAAVNMIKNTKLKRYTEQVRLYHQEIILAYDSYHTCNRMVPISSTNTSVTQPVVFTPQPASKISDRNTKRRKTSENAYVQWQVAQMAISAANRFG